MNWNEVPVILKDISLIVGSEYILDSLSIDFIPSRVTVLMGGSGCGKSTVLKAAAGLTPLSAGKVLYGDQSIYSLNQKEYAKMQQNTGFMFQDGALWANKNIIENLSLPIIISDNSVKSESVEKMVMDGLKAFNMEFAKMIRPAALSAGEKKIISFLRAVITDPDILFLDEPTSFIDNRSSLKLIKNLFRFKKEGKTIIMVTHDLKLAKTLGDYIVFMNDRKIELYDTVEACLESDNELWRNFIEDRSSDSMDE
ncbi:MULTISPECIES: ATP-binding cassette domain-containing protein [unclassified Oceanispirochaeta]|uniref:ATP-binding cassette domain-containing protein n=1 Tax=unclassified Oceanispirochaeta TaxID=2635722 RepID=UPI0013141BD8|nr:MULTISPECIES: ATP-binding cassette domain-containing protein [unclassified Oceanispirochaeta]MBF9015554.1 ATP-binding cassette domain-containing protein [Oceanispirochaeta sp. M2]NPD73957.1 ATP-binding cassette domain-containing protein [Oceanispirochaeta sp. M1]